MTAFLQAACELARAGAAVFPLSPKDKKPYPFTRGLLDASADPDVAFARWRGASALPMRERRADDGHYPDQVLARPTSNIAAATGPASGFWVLDLDGPEAETALDQLVGEHGELPETPEQITGGGRQLLFAWEPAFPLRNSAGKIGPKIDVRGDGGYVVLPPSVHPGDPRRGIPPGRQYHWAAGRALGEIPLARAPDWLVRLAMPAEPVAAAAAAKPRLGQDGRASRFGEATLATACRLIATAPLGKRQQTIWGYACQIGGFVAGGEIQEGYAREQLQAAALNMQAGLCDTPEAVRRHVDRGLEAGKAHPREAPPLRSSPASTSNIRRMPQTAPADEAREISRLLGIWRSASSMEPEPVKELFGRLGIDPEGMNAYSPRLKIIWSNSSPFYDGPACLLLPLYDLPPATTNVEPEALAFVPLKGDGRIKMMLGPWRGKAAYLCEWPEDGALLVAMDFADAWELGTNAWDNGHQLGVVLAPTIGAFAGAPAADKYGRVDPLTPTSDPERPPWTVAGDRAVFLAVRNDLHTPELKVRQTFGGTERTRLQGDAAARFYGSLAEQAWTRAGANPVRILRPRAGQAGFVGA